MGLCLTFYQESTLKHEETSEMNMTTRSLDLVNKDNSIFSKIKKLQDNVKKQPRKDIDNEIPTIISQDLKQINMPIKPMEDQVGDDKENIKKPEEPEEELPTENQPMEEDVESIGED